MGYSCLMSLADLAPVLGTALTGALEKKGYTELTSVQEAVLAPALANRDLRITSQTGSGKTVAVGFAMRELVLGDCRAQQGVARPRALVVAPTRELARQVEEELSWLYAPLEILVTTTTGGASARDERRALARGPAVIVGTPGRLLDHLTRGSIDTTQLQVVVLDEADRMLDLGFRDDLKAILAYAPAEHRTHLVSATFPREVRALADGVQQNAAHVEGTRLGAANVDIDHRVHLVDSHEKVNAIINLLLSNPDSQTLVFGRTRADVANIAKELSAAKFAVGSLSGEMDQIARNRALAGFKRGELRVLVATDVAARGIDVQDIAFVIHAEPPTDADSYTHRSGRTGRAGRKGTSSVLVTPAGLRQAWSLLSRARVTYRMEPIPTAEEIRSAADDRLVAELLAEPATEDGAGGAGAIDGRTKALAERLAADPSLPRILARLLLRVRTTGGTEPRPVRRLEPRGDQRPASPERPLHAAPARPTPHAASPYTPTARTTHASGDASQGAPHGASAHAAASHAGAGPRGREPRTGGWVSFQVSWGSEHGADARRLMAIVCRRGGIKGSDIGVIRVGQRSSMVEVASGVAKSFAEAALAPDPRDPRIRIRPADERVPTRPLTGRFPQRAEVMVVPDRPSRAAADRPSKTADRPSKTADRPSKTADRPSKTLHAPSKVAADRPSKARHRKG